MAASTLLADVMGTGLSRTVIDAVRQSNGSREGSRRNAVNSKALTFGIEEGLLQRTNVDAHSVHSNPGTSSLVP